MSIVVFDTSAVIALLRAEPGAAVVARHVGNAAMSTVNLQELVKALNVRGLAPSTIDQIVQGLRFDIHVHDREAAFAAALLWAVTRQYGSGLGDRTCMALAIKLGVPVLMADRAWARLRIPGLAVELVR